MLKKVDRNELRGRRRLRSRRKIYGTAERPRLNVFRSTSHIYAQLIDDDRGTTLIAASSLSPELKGKVEGGNVEGAAAVGALIAQRAKVKGITTVVFDRAGQIYHGRIKALAEAARTNGLEF